MDNVWVCKLDGAIQCDPDSSGETLEEMRELLALIIGNKNIVNMESRNQTMPQQCGLPTGTINAYEITGGGWWMLNHGFMGRQGFNQCLPDLTNDLSADPLNLGNLVNAFAGSNLTLIRELVGHPLRVYTTGDSITKDLRPERVNIEIDKKGKIVDVRFG